MTSSLGQVSEPGSPFFCGTVYQRHFRSPVSGSRASRYPGLSMSSPLTPAMSMFLTTTGATEA